MWQDLDYFRTKDGLVYLVKGNHHPDNIVRAYPVYWPSETGERYHLTRGSYHKKPTDPNNNELYRIYPQYRPSKEPLSVPAVQVKDIEEHFLPRQAAIRFAHDQEQQETIWNELYKSLLEAGVPQEDVGIIGSYLVEVHRDKEDRHIKDIDFVVYGLENMKKVKRNIEMIRQKLNATAISPEHVAYHAKKYQGILSPESTLALSLQRKWPALQLAPGLLDSIRFVYYPEETPPDPWALDKKEEIILQGEVVDDTHAVFMPRRFTVAADKNYQIVIPYWGWYSPVRNKDKVKIKGVLLEDNKTVVLLSQEHYLIIQ